MPGEEAGAACDVEHVCRRQARHDPDQPVDLVRPAGTVTVGVEAAPQPPVVVLAGPAVVVRTHAGIDDGSAGHGGAGYLGKSCGPGVLGFAPAAMRGPVEGCRYVGSDTNCGARQRVTTLAPTSSEGTGSSTAACAVALWSATPAGRVDRPRAGRPRAGARRARAAAVRAACGAVGADRKRLRTPKRRRP